MFANGAFVNSFTALPAETLLDHLYINYSLFIFSWTCYIIIQWLTALLSHTRGGGGQISWFAGWKSEAFL